jgi:ORF 12 gene product N-terminal
MKLGSRDSRPGRSAWPFLVALSTAAAPAKAVVPPDTTAGVQLRWLIAAMARLPLSGAQLRAHFDTAFLAQVSPAVLNQACKPWSASGCCRSASAS